MCVQGVFAALQIGDVTNHDHPSNNDRFLDFNRCRFSNQSGNFSWSWL